MKIHHGQTTDIIRAEIGRRLRERRLLSRLTQKELAAQAGLDPKSIAKLENGGDVNMTSLLCIMRALGRIGDLNLAFPDLDEMIDPFAVPEAEKKKRKPRRVRHPKPKA